MKEQQKSFKVATSKESAYELQQLDCNCNDCAYLIRDIEKHKQQIREDDASQLWFFRRYKARRIWNARLTAKKDAEKGAFALKEALALTYRYKPQVVQSNYGKCRKYLKDITFLPNTYQFNTQNCFIHRKDLEDALARSN